MGFWVTTMAEKYIFDDSFSMSINFTAKMMPRSVRVNTPRIRFTFLGRITVKKGLNF